MYYGPNIQTGIKKNRDDSMKNIRRLSKIILTILTIFIIFNLACLFFYTLEPRLSYSEILNINFSFKALVVSLIIGLLLEFT
jgi:hypothetical protein